MAASRLREAWCVGAWDSTHGGPLRLPPEELDLRFIVELYDDIERVRCRLGEGLAEESCRMALVNVQSAWNYLSWMRRKAIAI